MLKSLLFSYALVVFFSLRLQAQESQWTEVSYTLEVQSNQSVEQVRDELLKIARQKAVEKVSGFNVSTASLSNDSWESTEGDNNFFQSFKVLSNISSQGLIVEEQSPKYESLASGEQKITYMILFNLRSRSSAGRTPRMGSSPDRPCSCCSIDSRRRSYRNRHCLQRPPSC